MTGVKNSSTKTDILERLEDNITIIKKFGVKRIGLFGYAVRGELEDEIDIGLIIEFERVRKIF